MALILIVGLILWALSILLLLLFGLKITSSIIVSLLIITIFMAWFWSGGKK